MGDRCLWWGAHLNANTVFYFESLPIYRLISNIFQVGQGSVKLVLLNMCTQAYGCGALFSLADCCHHTLCHPVCRQHITCPP